MILHLLSLISNDATEFSVFKLNKSVEKKYSDPLFEQAMASAGPQPLCSEPFNALIGQNNAALLADNSLATLALNECLNPEPLANKNNSNYIEPAIIKNCALHTQKKCSVSRLLTN